METRIQNMETLLSSGNLPGRKAVVQILEAGLQAANPYHNTRKLIRVKDGKLIVGHKDFEPTGSPRTGDEVFDLSRIRKNYCFTLSGLTIAQLFQCRWQIEIFFKWIKQHLRIKAFYGTTENAVKTQIWITITVNVLVAIIKKQLKIDLSLYTIQQILSVTLFEKKPILEALSVIQPQEL